MSKRVAAICILFALQAQQSWSEPSQASLTDTPKSQTDLETSVGTAAREPIFSIALSPLSIGASAAFLSPIVPIEAAIHLGKGFAIGPSFTYFGKFTRDDVDFDAVGYGAHASWYFGKQASEDSFYIQGFYNHYTVTGTKMVDAGKLLNPVFSGVGSSVPGMSGMPAAMMVPIDGIVPIDSYGAELGYKWVWKSGFRLSTGVRVAYFHAAVSEMTLMGEKAKGVTQIVQLPALNDQSEWLPLPEVKIGWAF